MQIINYENNSVRKIVEKRAKYQKVMLIFDDFVSELEQIRIYEEVKDVCIFNKLHISQNANEIYNGYKLIIFCLNANSFLKFNYDIEEFVSVFIAQDECVLPFYLDLNSNKSESERYILTQNCLSDVNAVSSVFFNRLYNYISDLLNFQFSPIQFDFSGQEITQFNTLALIEQMDLSSVFIDVKIARETGINYSDLMLIDCVLVNAFLCVINAITNHSLELVDVYKATKNNIDLVDKFYALQTNQSFIRAVELNYRFLTTACNKTKEKILSVMSFGFTEDYVVKTISKIKHYSQNDTKLLGFLYLYNIFEY